MAAAEEWESGTEAGPTGDWTPPAAAASPANGKTATTESEAGASVSGESEAKVDDGSIQEAESSLREGLSLNYEVSATPLPLLDRSWLDLSKCIR
jgi:tetratricopeptide repeat protein 7